MNIRFDAFKAGLTERLCVHGIGHPDPDSVEFLASKEDDPADARWGWGVHGCDGCCRSS